MINFNGDLCHSDLVNNRSFLYADGVFETFKIIKGQILFFEDHYFRLMSSMRIMRMDIPMNFTLDVLKNEILKTIISDDLSGSARMTVYRKAGGKYFPETNQIDYLINFNASQKEFYVYDNSEVVVDIYNDFHISAQLLSTLKTTAKNLYVLAGIYAKENDLDNCILLNDKKEVVEFINGNLFLVSNNTISTPPISSGCINGIIRKQLLKLIPKHTSYQIEERTISPFELQQADELFLTNINMGIQPINQFRKKIFNANVSKSLTEILNSNLSF